MKIYCCQCCEEVDTRLTDGAEIYPHREDLDSLPFWIHDKCGNFVGCHHKTPQRTKPLGCIPTKEIKNARKHIHALLDPMWKTGPMKKRGQLYAEISSQLGYQFHTAEIRSIEEARRIYRIILDISKKCLHNARN